ncbi:MAG: hypothetical protein HY868_16670 [Chloroflexi bacterium]|nr:hypothetical protein [Chloroflexota bacterium]
MTPTPTPIPGVNFYWDLQTAAPLTAGAVWAVLILLLFVCVFQRKQRILLGTLGIVIVSMPLSIINAGWWALTVYLFVTAFVLLGGILQVGE